MWGGGGVGSGGGGGGGQGGCERRSKIPKKKILRVGAGSGGVKGGEGVRSGIGVGEMGVAGIIKIIKKGGV